MARNVVYCLTHFPQFREKDASLALMLGVSESTIYRWRVLDSKPQRSNVLLVAQLAGIDPNLILESSHADFVKQISGLPIYSESLSYRNVNKRVVFPAIAKWMHAWPECFRKHSGHYFMYTGALSDPDLAAISLLQIIRLSTHGIVFEISNVDSRFGSKSRPMIYKYDGLAFPVFDCINFMADESSGDEILTMVVASSQLDTPFILSGYMNAVGVSPTLRIPAGTRVALRFGGRRIVDALEVVTKLGTFPKTKIEAPIQKLLWGHA